MSIFRFLSCNSVYYCVYSVIQREILFIFFFFCFCFYFIFVSFFLFILSFILLYSVWKNMEYAFASCTPSISILSPTKHIIIYFVFVFVTSFSVNCVLVQLIISFSISDFCTLRLLFSTNSHTHLHKWP